MENIDHSMIHIENYLIDTDNETLEKMILEDLSAAQKKISSKFFYDAKGSHLFEEITKLPEYYLTRTEIDLLKQVADDIKKKCHHIDLIEFGSGNCTKISILLGAIPNEFHPTVRYIPFDVSIDAVQKSSEILLKKFPNLQIHGIVADFMSQLNVIPANTQKIICFLGSTIGNFSMDQAVSFLTELGKIMNTDDLLLLGFDRVKKKDIIESAYNDKLRVTEQFNKNILSVINTLINTDFNPDFSAIWCICSSENL